MAATGLNNPVETSWDAAFALSSFQICVRVNDQEKKKKNQSCILSGPGLTDTLRGLTFGREKENDNFFFSELNHTTQVP